MGKTDAINLRAEANRVFPERAESYWRVSIKIGEYVLAVTSDSFLNDEEKAKEVAKEINKDIFKYLKKFHEGAKDIEDWHKLEHDYSGR